MLYLCPMSFRRKPSGGRPVSCSLTVHWLYRPGRLLEARVMKADIVSCLWAKAHGYVLRPRQGVGLRGIPFPQNSASGFGPSLLHPASVASSSSRKSHFTASSIGSLSRPVASSSSRKSHFTASSVAPLSRLRACPSSRWPHFTASFGGSPFCLRACLSFRKPHFTALSGEPSFGLCGIPPFSPSFYPK